jgi:mono/diheme cytochrome c family protein
MRFRAPQTILLSAFGLAVWTLGVAAQSPPPAATHEAGPHTHAEAAKLPNPQKPTSASIAAGAKLYTSQCAACHGNTGKGDGKAAAQLNPKPPDLTDAEWTHGPSDGEVFTLIRDGAGKGSTMKGFAAKFTTTDLWNIVNYIRSLSTAKGQ